MDGSSGPAVDADPRHDPITRWVAINTHPHRESVAVENLARQKFNVYCPTERRRVRHARRVQDVTRPIFPGYVFAEVAPDLAHWRSILSTYGVRAVIRYGDRPAFVEAGFIEGLAGSRNRRRNCQAGHALHGRTGDPAERRSVRWIDCDDCRNEGEGPARPADAPAEPGYPAEGHNGKRPRILIGTAHGPFDRRQPHCGVARRVDPTRKTTLRDCWNDHGRLQPRAISHLSKSRGSANLRRPAIPCPAQAHRSAFHFASKGGGGWRKSSAATAASNRS